MLFLHFNKFFTYSITFHINRNIAIIYKKNVFQHLCTYLKIQKQKDFFGAVDLKCGDNSPRHYWYGKADDTRRRNFASC